MKRALPYLFAATTALTACNQEKLSKELAPASVKTHWYQALAQASCKDQAFNVHAHEALENGHLVILSAEDIDYYPAMVAESHTLQAALVDGGDVVRIALRRPACRDADVKAPLAFVAVPA